MAGPIEDHRRDRIRLQLPAEAAYGRLARIAATTLARRLGFGFRAIEDLGLALDETLIFLLSATGSEPADRLEVLLDVHGDALAVDVVRLETPGAGATAAPGPDAAPTFPERDVARFRSLVDDVVAEWHLDAARPGVRLLARR